MTESLVELAVSAYNVLVSLSWLAIAVSVLVLGPMAMFPKSRTPAGVGFFFASYLFGVTTWLLGAMVTFATVGWLGLIIGMLLFGVGVVPIAIFVAFFLLKQWSLGVTLIVMSVLVYATRAMAVGLAD